MHLYQGYERFSKELFKYGSYACGDGDEDGVYRVVLISSRADQGLIEYRVGVSPDRMDYFGQCKNFEHSGIPCHHVLRVSSPEFVEAMQSSVVFFIIWLFLCLTSDIYHAAPGPDRCGKHPIWSNHEAVDA